jgi:hypothetical protein
MGDGQSAFAVRAQHQLTDRIEPGPVRMIASLHSDPRWLPFLRKIGLAPEQLAAIKFDVRLPQ